MIKKKKKNKNMSPQKPKTQKFNMTKNQKC